MHFEMLHSHRINRVWRGPFSWWVCSQTVFFSNVDLKHFFTCVSNEVSKYGLNGQAPLHLQTPWCGQTATYSTHMRFDVMRLPSLWNEGFNFFLWFLLLITAITICSISNNKTRHTLLSARQFFRWTFQLHSRCSAWWFVRGAACSESVLAR